MRHLFAVAGGVLAVAGVAASCSSFGDASPADAGADAPAATDASLDASGEAASGDAAVLPVGKTVDRAFTCASLSGRRVLLCKDFLETDAGAVREGLDVEETNMGSVFVEKGATPPENVGVTEVPTVSAVARVSASRTPAGAFVLSFDFDLDDFASVLAPRPVATVAIGAATMTMSASDSGLSVATGVGNPARVKLLPGWHRLFARGEGATVAFFVDGEPVGSAPFASGANVTMTLGLGKDGVLGSDPPLRARFDNLVIVAD